MEPSHDSLPQLQLPLFFNQPLRKALEYAGPFYKGTIRVFIKDHATSFDIFIYPLFVKMDGPCPPPGDERKVTWYHKGEAVKPTEAQLGEEGPGAEDLHARSRRVLRFLMARSHNKAFASITSVAAEVFGERAKYCKPMSNSKNNMLYYGEALYEVSANVTTIFRPSLRFLGDYPDLSEIKLDTRDPNWVWPIINQMSKVWQRDGDFEGGWQRGVQMAREFKDRIRFHVVAPRLAAPRCPAPSNKRDRDMFEESAAAHEPRHPCAGCFLLFRCKSLREGLCPTCASRKTDAPRPRMPKVAVVKANETYAFTTLERQWGITEGEAQRRKDVASYIDDQFSTKEPKGARLYFDGYCGAKIFNTDSSQQCNKTPLEMWRRDGLHPSVDAVQRLAYRRLPDGQLQIGAHIPGNVVLTLYGFNMLHCDKPIIVNAPVHALRRARSAKDYQRAFRGVLNASVITTVQTTIVSELARPEDLDEHQKMTLIDEMHAACAGGIVTAARLAEVLRAFWSTILSANGKAIPSRALDRDEVAYRWEQFHQIAEMYGFGGAQHEYLWTITHRGSGTKVFHPFSVLVRPYAEEYFSENHCEACFTSIASSAGLGTEFVSRLMFLTLHQRFIALKKYQSTRPVYKLDGRPLLLALDDFGLECVFWKNSLLSPSFAIPNHQPPRLGFTIARPTDQQLHFDASKCNIRFITRVLVDIQRFPPEAQDRLGECFDNLKKTWLPKAEFWDSSLLSPEQVRKFLQEGGSTLADDVSE